MILRGVIFDLDGTLLDSMSYWETVGSDYVRSRGFVPEEGLDEKLKPMSMADAVLYCKTRYGFKESVGEIARGVFGILENRYRTDIPLKPGAIDLLEKLKNQGVLMCVATATDRYMIEPALKRTGIDKYFLGVFTCSEVGVGKDSPEIFEKALKLLGTDKKDTVIFEDALYAIKTAKDAGFQVAAVYDPSADNEQNEIRKLSDYYITSFERGEVLC